MRNFLWYISSLLIFSSKVFSSTDDSLSMYIFLDSIHEFEWDSASVLLNLETGGAGSLPTDIASLNWSYTLATDTTGKIQVNLEATPDSEFNSTPLELTMASNVSPFATGGTVNLTGTPTTAKTIVSAMASGFQSGAAGTIEIAPTLPGHVPDEKDYYFFLLGTLSDT